MAETTGISWSDSTFNPWIGCTKVSPACDHCYAERLMDHRMHKVQWGAGQPRVRTSAANWRKPLQWNAQPFCACMGCGWRGELREAGSTASPVGFDRDPGAMRTCSQCKQPLIKEARRRVFCASLADVFDNEVPHQWRVDLFTLIADTPHLDWLLLTKRIGNAKGDMLPPLHWPWPNVWLGATICNQEEADRDIPKLLAVPAAVRFLSIEPMLGRVDLTAIRMPLAGKSYTEGNVLAHKDSLNLGAWRAAIDWIICGGESGPHARPMHPDWVRSLRDQCAAAGVPFHFKQWGEWIPGESEASADGYRIAYPDEGCGVELGDGRRYATTSAHGREFLRLGTKAAGRLLDGVEHNGFPQYTKPISTSSSAP